MFYLQSLSYGIHWFKNSDYYGQENKGTVETIGTVQ